MSSSLSSGSQLLKSMGARIKSELNDLKRTPESCATELKVPLEHIQAILEGSASNAEVLAFIDLLGDSYPLDKSDLLLPVDDTTGGAKIMRSAESKASSRVFGRADRNGARTPYYEYRDTAMSRLAPFRPEWIKEERVVFDNDPENPDVVYNNGHLLHQMTFFIGPVNFYYKLGSQAHCVEMTTGDSNYIMPFYPHSFASRDPHQLALIIAVTFGGDVRRAQKELYTLGHRGERYHLDFRTTPPRLGLLRQHLANARITPEVLGLLLARNSATLSLSKALDPDADLSPLEIEELAAALQLHPSDLMAAPYASGDDVRVVFRKDQEAYPFPSAAAPHYLIRRLAQHRAMPLVRGLDLEVVGLDFTPQAAFETGLHTYVYNYGDQAVKFSWTADGQSHQTVLEPEDSVYLQPFVEHAFAASAAGQPGRLLMVSLPGYMGLSAMKEFSYFESASRVVRETKKWFD